MSGVNGTILVTGWPLVPEAEQLLQDRGFWVQVTDPSPDQAELVLRLKQTAPDAIVVRTGIIDRACLDAAPGLKAIANHGAGYDDIDVAEATRRGIPVFAAPGRNAVSVAEHVFALLLAVRKSLPAYDRLVRTGGWRLASPEIAELYGAAMGVVGLGAIGERVAMLAHVFGMSVMAHDRSRVRPWPDHIACCPTLDELLERSDVVSLHVPLTQATNNLIDSRRLDLMKPGSILINAARGGVVDEIALAHAVEAGRLFGAGLDTFAQEPSGADAPSAATPHRAFAARRRRDAAKRLPHVDELCRKYLQLSAGWHVQRRSGESGLAAWNGLIRSTDLNRLGRRPRSARQAPP